MDAINLKMLRRSLFNIPASKSVCRNLFGEVDHEETKADIQKEMKEAIEFKSNLWNFDFEKNQPRGKENGLIWTPLASEISDYNLQPHSPHPFNSTTTTTATQKRPHEAALNDEPCVKTEEDRIIRIINASPPRPCFKTIPNNPLQCTQTTSKSGKRKRLSQPKIDDFMKKKKARMSVSLSLQDKYQITTRLRSSQVPI